MMLKSTKKTFLLALLLTLVFGSFLFSASSVFGQDEFGVKTVQDEIILGSDDIRVTVVRIINTLLGLLGIIAVGIILYGGFVYMTAGGAEDKIATAKKILVNGVIGLVIILSAFAITRFVLNKLIDATGADITVTDTLPGSCDEPGTPYYEKYNGTTVCDAYCNLYPKACCFAEHFLVKSITPSTPRLDEETGMYNIVVRALFSRSVAGDAEDVFDIFLTPDGSETNVTDDFTFSFNDDRSLVEARFTGKLCDESLDPITDDTCLTPGTYKVSVGNVVDEDGNELETSTTCGDFPKDASFSTGEREQDYIEFQTPFTAGKSEGGHVLMTAIRIINDTSGQTYIFDPFDPLSGCEISGDWTLLSDMEGYPGDITSVVLDVKIGGNIVSTEFPIHIANSQLDASIRCGVSAAEENRVEYGLYTPTTTLGGANMYVHVMNSVDETIVIDQDIETPTWKEMGPYTLGQYDNFIDKISPVLDPLMINNTASDGVKLIQGSTYPIKSVLKDAKGNAYGELRIYKEDDGSSNYYKRYIDGPYILDGSSGAFAMSYGFRIPYSFEINTNYVAELRAHDIDSNETVDTVVFSVIPDYCTDPDHAEDPDCNPNNEGKSCKVQADCAEWLKCLDTDNTLCAVGDLRCVCTAWPYIESIEPLDGAEGNWVTIKGLNFGDEDGEIRFNYTDTNLDGDFEDANDKSATSSLAECRNDVWTDSWIIAEVPDEIISDPIIKPSISVKHAGTGFVDYTNDDFGAVLEAFTYNSTKRPGLCAVEVSETTQIDLLNGQTYTFAVSSTTAVPGVPIVASGIGFGGHSAVSELDFNGVKASISSASWSDTIINSVVPYANPGTIAVFVRSLSNEKSNPVEFNVLSIEDFKPPVILSIDPATTTPGSYITIYGTNFGNSEGTVTIGNFVSAPLPNYCGDNWSDEQIIVKVPSNIIGTSPNWSATTLPVVVTRHDNQLKSASSSLRVVPGVALPSICALSPDMGPAPLRDGEVLTIQGENFSPILAVYFWGPNSVSSTMSTWLNDVSVAGGGNVINVNTGTHITTPIPVDTNEGYSMISGPIRVMNSSYELSNSIRYEVDDCRDPGAGKITGFQCCSVGKEAGRWKDDDFVCEGDTREAGYVWRFTTGKIAEKFNVLESCSESLPSPSPWREWPQGESACVNAEVQASFSLPVDRSKVVLSAEGVVGAINSENVNIYTCGSGDTIDCSNSTNVTSNFEGDLQVNALVMNPTSGLLDSDTWYRVAFSSNVKSLRNEIKFGESIPTSENLLATNPCDINGDGNNDAAYCFEFKTGGVGEICTLVGANIQKHEYTTKLLGVVQDPRWTNLFDVNRVFNAYDPEMKPLYYFVHGIANQECTTINVDEKPWEWGPVDGSGSSVSSLKFPNQSYVNSRGIAKAWSNNYPGGDEISARVDEGLPVVVSQQQVEVVHDILNDSGLANPFEVYAPTDGSIVDGVDHDYNWGEADSIKISVALETPPDGSKAWSAPPGDTSKSHYDYILFKSNNDVSNGDLRMFIKTEVRNSDGFVRKTLSFSVKENGASKSVNINLSPEVNDFDIVITNVKVDSTTTMVVDVYESGIYFGTKNLVINSNWDNSGTKELYIGRYSNNDPFYSVYGSINKFEITETISEDVFAPRDITATSTLFVDLSKPRVIDKWPFCSEACINAEIGAKFDQIMDESTYGTNIELYKCRYGEACLILNKVTSVVSTDISDSSNIRAYANANLDKNSWYVVKVSNGIHALAGIDFSGDVTITKQGKAIEETQWKFRTKNSDEPCVVDRVNVEPNPFTATYIGQKQKYNALPKGAPDSCSPYGQNLNPWDYGWEWSVKHDYVAEVTGFSMSSAFKKACTINCLPGGSDVLRSSYTAPYPICGNGIIDAGEDCDIASTTPDGVAESPGISCSYLCLRPGNREKGSTEDGSVNTCGNGAVEYSAGEECDFNDPNLLTSTSEGETVDYRPYCSDICLWTGSTRDETGDIAKPVCGSTGVTLGEDCDVKDPLTMNGCSDQCLHKGTALMQSWCDDTDLSSASEVCNYATSVCGNGIIELGEVCEVDVSGATDETCNDLCLLYIEDIENNADEICNNPNLKQCNAGDDGCTQYCTLAGSSIFYPQSSVCWDGIAGTGEYAGNNIPAGLSNLSCEVSLGDAANELGNNPVQIVTSLGLPPGADVTALIDEDEDGFSELQRTLVKALPAMYRSSDGIPEETDRIVEGEGVYTLQCGYVEFGDEDDAEMFYHDSGSERSFGFSFDEASGSTTFTDSINDHVITCSGSSCPVISVSGIYGNALSFDGTDDYVIIPGSDSSIDMTDAVTLEAWIKPEVNGSASSGYQTIVGRTLDYSLLITNDGLLRASITNEDGGRVLVDTQNVVSMYQWNHVAMTYDGQQIKTYVNGELVGTKSQTGLTRQSLDFRIGNFRTAGYGFQGLIDEVRVYDRALSYDEIAESANAFLQSETILSNDCPNNSNNNYGVATNSCCYIRPERQDQYPAVNQGISIGAPVCRNTYLEVEFNREMDPFSFDNNISIVQGYPEIAYPSYSCAENGGEDITLAMNTLLGISPGDIEQGFWGTLWNRVKSFFARLFAGQVFAVTQNDGLSGNITWCTSDIKLDNYIVYNRDEANPFVTTTVSLYLDKAFDSNVYVAVMLDGRLNKIKDINGVGIKDPNSASRLDYWIFRTGDEICKIDYIEVDPNRHLFQTPDSEQDFQASVTSLTGGQSIVRLPDSYYWEWSWQPVNNVVFNIPSDDIPNIRISTKGVEGHIGAIVSAKVTVDNFPENNQLDRKFIDTFDLTSFFCTNPWPSINTLSSGSSVSTSVGVFEDTTYNYASKYCADDGNPLTTDDDLPLFDNITSIANLGDLGLTSGMCAGTSDLCMVNEDCPSTVTFNGESTTVEGINPGICTAKVPGTTYYPINITGCSNTVYCSGVEFPEGTPETFTSLCDRTAEVEQVQCVHDTPQTTLARYLFFSSTTEDVIGAQIFNNPPNSTTGSRTTLDEWYAGQFDNLANMQSASVGNYDALIDSSNIYINFFNFSKDDTDITDKGSIDNYIVLFSIDTNADEKTRKVFEQFINYFKLNTNFSDYGLCLSIDIPADTSNPIRTHDGNLSDIECETDLDCRDEDGLAKVGTIGECSSQSSKFVRDLKRLQDTRIAQSRIEQYAKAHQDDLSTDNFKIDFQSGSYMQGYTNSRWQTSWGLLGSYVGGLSVDPINSWVGCADHDDITCVNAVSSTFKCPQFSQVYEYTFVSSTKSYVLNIPFEFFTPTDAFINQYINTSKVEFGQSCDPGQIQSKYQGICGDGILNPAIEECDPPNKKKILQHTYNATTGELEQCEALKYAEATCSATCEWNYGACTVGAGAVCGDGIVEYDKGEMCDDGLENGDYGKCDVTDDVATGATACVTSGFNGGYCGDGALNVDGDLNPLEFCDDIGGVCQYVTDNGVIVKPEVQIVLDRSGTMRKCADGSGAGGATSGLPIEDQLWCDSINYNPLSRWELAKTGIERVFTNFQDLADFTLHVFSATHATPQQCSVQVGDKNNFLSELDTITPWENTPTKDALSEIYTNRNSLFTNNLDIPRIVILVTDGKPVNLIEPYSPITCSGNTVQDTVEVIDLLAQEGISTYVVGFGDAETSLQSNLDEFAEAGGTNNKNSSRKFYEANDSTQLFEAFEDILSCSEYSKLKRGSCSFNCQNYGSYCGDGVTQWDNEECDDGNSNPNDSCTNSCTIPPAGASAVCGNGFREADEQCDDGNSDEGDGCSSVCKFESDDPFCGDGEKNQNDEQCDLGAENGELCEAKYGEECTYCSSGTLGVGGCRIKTITSEMYCGNGKIDYDGTVALEACDYISDGQGGQSSVLKPYPVSQSDFEYECSSSNDEYSVIKTSDLHNPMNEVRGAVSCDNKCQKLNTDSCVQCGLKPVSDGGIRPQMSILNVMTGQRGDREWYNFPTNVSNSTMNKSMFGNYYNVLKETPIEPDYMGKGLSGNSLPSYTYTGQQYVAYGATTGDDLSNPAWGIETDAQCRDFYGIYYNKDIIDSGYLGGEGTFDKFLERGSYFPYQVDGKPGVLKRDFVVSPAVPAGDVRVVVRWDRTKNSNIKFVGNYFRTNQNSFEMYGDNINLCEKVVEVDDYWVADYDCNRAYTSAHSFIEGKTVGVQAYTFYSVFNVDDDKIGFIVSSLNGPINLYKDYDIWVDVYLPHANQLGLYSIYEPDETYYIGDAFPSDYNNARYWHPFNLEKVSGQYVTSTAGFPENPAYDGAIKTNLCEVKKRIPGAVLCTP